MKVQVKVDKLAWDVFADVLGNIVLMLETGKDPMKVALELRDYIAKTDAENKQQESST